MRVVQVDKIVAQQPNGGMVVTFPDAVLVAAREDRTQFERRVLVQTLGSLYAEGRISAGLGAQVLGCDRWEFYRLLTEHGFAVLEYAADEHDAEAATSRALAASITARA